MKTFRLLLATNRPAIGVFLAQLNLDGSGPPEILRQGIGPQSSVTVNPKAAEATVALVDVSVDWEDALILCRQLRSTLPRLPVAALFCCPHSTGFRQIVTLASVGVQSALDLHLTPEEASHALSTLARGRQVVALELESSNAALLSSALRNIPGRAASRLSEVLAGSDNEIISLVARGLSDKEISKQLNFSQRTIGHRIEQLRTLVRVRNRTELAAWAGARGLYTTMTD